MPTRNFQSRQGLPPTGAAASFLNSGYKNNLQHFRSATHLDDDSPTDDPIPVIIQSESPRQSKKQPAPPQLPTEIQEESKLEDTKLDGNQMH